jgi:outer membrane protein assembly factor BamA
MIFGQERTWFLDFQDPWIAGDHVSINLGMYDFYSDGAVYAYEYHEKGGYAGIGFYQGDHNKYNVKMGVKTISVDTAGVIPDERWVLGTFIYDYHYLYAIFNYQYDTRDVFVDPTKGQHLKLNLKPRIGVKNTHNYYQFNYEHTYYYQISQDFRNPVLSITSSLFIQKPERIPPFSYVYIGGEDYVRGYSPNPCENPETTPEIEGVHALYESIQLQHTLFPRKDYGGIELGIDVVYFLDMGVSSKNLNSIDLKNGIVGYGFGLRFFASGAGVIGIDIGFNPYGTYFIHPTSVN